MLRKKYLKYDDLKVGYNYYNVERNIHDGSIRYVKCEPANVKFSNGKSEKIVYGIWANDHNYKSLGYIPVKKSKGRVYGKKKEK